MSQAFLIGISLSTPCKGPQPCLVGYTYLSHDLESETWSFKKLEVEVVAIPGFGEVEVDTCVSRMTSSSTIFRRHAEAKGMLLVMLSTSGVGSLDTLMQDLVRSCEGSRLCPEDPVVPPPGNWWGASKEYPPVRPLLLTQIQCEVTCVFSFNFRCYSLTFV